MSGCSPFRSRCTLAESRILDLWFFCQAAADAYLLELDCRKTKYEILDRRIDGNAVVLRIHIQHSHRPMVKL